MPTDYKYYPALSDRISVDDLPNFLSFIKESITNLGEYCYSSAVDYAYGKGLLKIELIQ